MLQVFYFKYTCFTLGVIDLSVLYEEHSTCCYYIIIIIIGIGLVMQGEKKTMGIACEVHFLVGIACGGMGWLWLVGWIKLQVSFAKETYKRDAIL